MDVDFRIAQLMISRLCHEMAGPVGAVNAGLELVQEAMEDGIGDADALGLVHQSGVQLSRRLAFYRVAFGSGAGLGGKISLADVRGLAEGLLSGGTVELDWSDGDFAGPNPMLRADAIRLYLNLISIGAECLPRGGVLRIHQTGLPNGLGVAVQATGTGARICEETRQAIEGKVAVKDLDARNIHTHLVALFAEELGISVEIGDNSENEVRFAIILPA